MSRTSRNSRSLAQMDELIADYLSRKESITKQGYCKEVKVSPSCFYRHLARHQIGSNKQVPNRQEKRGSFIELKPKSIALSGKTSCRIIFRFLGLKLFRLELEYV